MKRILINATHAEEIRVALCNGNHLYDFDLENRTREQKKANIYKGHVTRVEPSLEAVFVEYGSARQGFLPIREIASDYLSGDPRSGNIKNLIKEGDELIVQIEKEERGNKGAALSTFVSLAGRYLVLMPNNPRGGGISRQISGKLRDEMKQILSNLRLPKGMSVIIRTAGIGKSSEDLQQDLDHLLTIWKGIQEQNKKYPSPRLVHQEAGVVTRAVRDYLRDDISEIWVDNENAYNEAANFIEAVMPQQASKLRKYTDFEPMFARFGIEKQIETAYQREVRLPSGGSIVIDQTEALVSIDINSSKATKGADVSETAYNTNLEAADEIARQLRLRDMGGLIVIDFIDMATSDHQKQVENRLRDATKNDRARIQFAEISRFGLLEMSRQRLRPSLEEATGFLCPRCHGNGMIRDLRSLALSIMRQIEQKALLERQGEVQAEVPTEIAAFLLNEKRESLVYLEQDSGVRITILPHAHLESPNFTLTYNREGFAPTSYERISESEQSEIKDRGYDTNWHTEQEVLDSQIRQTSHAQKPSNAWSNANAANTSAENMALKSPTQTPSKPQTIPQLAQPQTPQTVQQPSAVAWLSNLFAPTQQATLADTISSQAAAAAIEDIVNAGGKSLGIHGQLAAIPVTQPVSANADERRNKRSDTKNTRGDNRTHKDNKDRYEKEKVEKSTKTVEEPKTERVETKIEKSDHRTYDKVLDKAEQKPALPKREPHSRRESRGEKERKATLTPPTFASTENTANLTAKPEAVTSAKTQTTAHPVEKSTDLNNVTMHVMPITAPKTKHETIQLSLDGSKAEAKTITEFPKKAVENPADTLPISSDTATVVPTTAVPPKTPEVTHQPQKVITKENITTPMIPPVTRKTEQPVTAPPVLEQSVSQSTFKAEFQLPTPTVDIQVTPALPVIPAQGRAKNDPREVYKHFMQHQGPATASVPTPVVENAIDPAIHSVAQTAQKITGTVGQFIDQHLPDTLKEGVNVVSHFLEAMHVFGKNQTRNPESMPAIEKTVVETVLATAEASHGKFDEKFNQFFRNYGFTAIAAHDLETYHGLRQPENRYVCEAGKNDSQPTPPTQRASNDPRGQVVTSAITPTTPTDKAATADKVAKPAKSPKSPQKTNKADTPTQAATANSPYQPGSTGEWIVARLGEAGQALIVDGKLVEAFLQASQTNVNQAIVQDIHPVMPAMAKDAHALISETAIDATEKQADQLLHVGGQMVASEAEAARNPFETLPDAANTTDTDNGAKSKTSPSSYKNMIESVAEQMSMGQSTILKLSPAKPVPKSRVRKEKTADKVAIKAPAKPKTRASKKLESAVVTKVVKKEANVVSETHPNEDGS